MRGQSDKVVAIIVTRLDSLSENLAVQTMLPAFYEQGYDPIMMESQFSRRWSKSISACSPGAILTAWCCSVLPALRRDAHPWRETLVLLARDAPASPPSAMTTRARSTC
jgi:LacI family trehalose operon transcriptional repressor